MPDQLQYIPSGSSQMFSYFHEPKGLLARDRAVLICNSGNQEYTRCHWALKALADSLSKNGFAVMRFDYTSTGDSSGETGGGSVTQWVEDAVAAGTALKKMAQVQHIQVIGIRLGAVIATRAAEKLGAIHQILWDPITDGSRYLSQLRAYNKQFAQDKQVAALQQIHESYGECLGFPINLRMLEELGDITPASYHTSTRFCHSIFSSEEQYDEGRTNLPSKFNCSLVEDSGDWDDAETARTALFAGKISKEIVDITERPNQ